MTLYELNKWVHYQCSDVAHKINLRELLKCRSQKSYSPFVHSDWPEVWCFCMLQLACSKLGEWAQETKLVDIVQSELHKARVWAQLKYI